MSVSKTEIRNVRELTQISILSFVYVLIMNKVQINIWDKKLQNTWIVDNIKILNGLKFPAP